MTEPNVNNQHSIHPPGDGAYQEPLVTQERAEFNVQENEKQRKARLSPGAIIFGVLVSAGFIAFVLLARVTVHPFDKVDRRMRVLDVWQRLRNHLPDVAHPAVLRVIFDVSIVMIIVGSLACIWLALLASNDEESSGDDTPTSPQPLVPSEH